jgi:hypothetical protein
MGSSRKRTRQKNYKPLPTSVAAFLAPARPHYIN